MAHAIDIACADDRPTIRARSARAIGTRSCGCGAPRAGHSAARRRLQLRHDRHDDRLQFADDRLVEATVRERRTRRICGPSSRLEADRPDARLGSAHHDVDASPAAARRDTLVHAIAGAEAGCAAHDCGARLACRSAAPSTRTLHAIDRSRVRDEGRGCDGLYRLGSTRTQLHLRIRKYRLVEAATA